MDVKQIAEELDIGAFYEQQTESRRRQPQGLISVIGMSDRLDTFLMQAEVDSGGLPDQMSPEEARPSVVVFFFPPHTTRFRSTEGLLPRRATRALRGQLSAAREYLNRTRVEALRFSFCV